jgi:hypothetical protein
MFQPRKKDSGLLDTLLTASSTTIAKGDALDYSSGYVQRATSASTVIHCIAMEDKVTASAVHSSILVLWTYGVEFEGDTAGSTSQALEGTYIDLTDHDTLNQAASTTNVFFVRKVISSSKVVGVFMPNVA